MLLIDNKLFCLQALPADSFSFTTSRESELCDAAFPELPAFAHSDMVLFY